MSLMEVLVALATILILIAALIGVGSYVKTRANLDLTKASLETLCTALAQYHRDFGDFPFEADLTYDKTALEGVVNGLNGTVMPPTVSLEEIDGAGMTVSTASSAALFYFLDRNPASRAIVEDISNSLVTNKDDNGADIKFTFTVSGNMIDLPRYIDPWGVSIRYEYLTGTAFPVLTSAGPDRLFDTPDDITSK